MARQAIIFHGTGGPYGCDADQGRYRFDAVGGTQTIRNDAHFGDWNQPYDTFPLVNQLIA